MSVEAPMEQITNGELSRAVKLIRDDIRDVKDDVAKRPTTRDLSYLETRIKDLEDWQKWAMRLGVPACIGVIVSLTSTISQQIPGH